MRGNGKEDIRQRFENIVYIEISWGQYFTDWLQKLNFRGGLISRIAEPTLFCIL